MDIDERRRLLRLAAWEPVVGAPGFSTGSLFRGPSPEVVRFTQEMADLGWSTRPDYGAWSQTPEGTALLEDDTRILGASADELALLLTTIIRMDRFSRGTLDAAFSRGTIAAITRRARVLAWTAPNERPAEADGPGKG